MRQLFLSFLLTLGLAFVPVITKATENPFSSSLIENLTSRLRREKFYTKAGRMVQDQINLIARIEQALTDPDPNRLRAVRGQLTVQVQRVESFVHGQLQSPQTFCMSQMDSSKKLLPLLNRLTTAPNQIYCSLYTSKQELVKLSPVLDRLLSRRGELALVRELPLVSGERQSDPVLSLAPVQYPQLGKPAVPFATLEPNLSTHTLATQAPSPEVGLIGRNRKTAIANYAAPVQPAITAPESAVASLSTAKQMLMAVQRVFPPEIRFTDPWENAAILDRFAYDLDPQEPKIYAGFLELPGTGIFRVLRSSVYQRPLNTVWNRLQPNVNERYPFPSLGDAKDGFNPSLALHMVGERFKLVDQGLDYSLMVEVGDIPLEKLDEKLQLVSSPTRELLLNYQPPKDLEALQIDKRRFLTGKHQNNPENVVILSHAAAELNHTYVVRSLQFQVSEKILNGEAISPEELQKIPGSDIILAFRPVRRRSDGSYTVLWRVLKEF